MERVIIINKATDLKFKGKTVAVTGIGISNRPLINYLLDKGAVITARDIKPREKLEPYITEIENKGVKIITGENYLDGINEEYIFRSPGIRYDKPAFINAVNNGSALTSEMELFLELCPAKITGVTGSNGKTTTTTIISLILEAQFGKVYVGGNIGVPLLPLAEQMTENDHVVVELSSFQLQTMNKSPDTAVITNISPNHLDYHKDMDEYAEAKKNIFYHQLPGSKLILNYNCGVTRGFIDEANPGVDVIYFGHESGVFEKDNIIYYKNEYILNAGDILLPGRHNTENYMAAIGATAELASKENIAGIAGSFNGVEHRMEFVRELNGIKYYNSSIDSSPSRTIAALSVFGQKVIVICGGSDKNIPFEPLVKPLIEKAKTIVLTGAARPKIKEALLNGGNTELPVIIEESGFADAVIKAHEAATPGDIVLLSPACASYDAFQNFEERGNLFKKIVNNLK